MHIAGKGVVEYLKSVRELAHIFQRLAVDDHARIARDELLDAVFHVAEAFQQHVAGILILMLAQHRMRQSLDGAGIRPDIGIDVRLRVRAGPLLVIILEQAAVKVFPIFFLLRYRALFRVQGLDQLFFRIIQEITHSVRMDHLAGAAHQVALQIVESVQIDRTHRFA